MMQAPWTRLWKVRGTCPNSDSPNFSLRSPFSHTHLNVNTVEGFLQLFMDFGIGYASVHQQYMQELYLELFSTS